MHSGGVAAYDYPQGGKKKATNFFFAARNVIVSGTEELPDGSQSYGTYDYAFTFYMSTTTTAASFASTTAAQAAVDAYVTKSNFVSYDYD